jgi:eukaryotic-like serine/threonine-protein kinase
VTDPFREALQTALAGRYAVEEVLGQGGMATVYRARDLRHAREVAIKVLRPELAAAIGAERFLREIRTTAALSHPNILPLYDSGEAGDVLFYVMPCVQQDTLRSKLTRERQLPLDEVVRVTREVAEALDHAHAQGVVHRDIKPENILFRGGQAAVCDFGIARAVTTAGADRLTQTGFAIGTPSYMSPEQATGDVVDGRSDVYALACVVYEMLAGEPPYSGPAAQAMIARRLTEPPPAITSVRPGVPPGVEAALIRALAQLPADRFRTAGEFAAALEAAVTAPRPVAAAGPARRARRRLVWGAAAALALVVAWMALRPGGVPAAGSEASRLAVLPFTVRAGDEFTYLGEGMVDLLSRNLDGVEGLRTVDPGTVLLAATGATPLDLERARGIARRVGAGLFVLGSAHAVGGRLRIQARLHAGGDEPLAQAEVEGAGDEVFDLVDRLAVQLFLATRQGAQFRLIGTAALTTGNLAALKEYLNAEAVLRAGSTDSALAGFQRAAAGDSAFALAYYRLAVAAGWSNRHDLAGQATASALALATRLGERDQRLLEAYAAFRAGRAAEAEEKYRALLRDYPDDLEAEFQLAEVLYRYNHLRGRPIAEAREPFDRVLAYDPGFL